MKNWGHSLALLGTWMLIPLGCSTADKVDLGETKGSALVDYAASWDGHAEAYKFDKTTSDRIRITLDANGDGTLEIGEQPLFPPPTDFDVGYPPGDDFTTHFSNPFVGRFRPGFRYPVHDAHIESGRLRLYVEPSDPFATWCEHQISYKDTVHTYSPPEDHYRCVPSAPVSLDNGCVISDGVTPPLRANCGKVTVCNADSPRVCDCAATGCTAARQEEAIRIQLDAVLGPAGASLEGTLVLSAEEGFPRVTVRLTRN